MVSRVKKYVLLLNGVPIGKYASERSVWRAFRAAVFRAHGDPNRTYSVGEFERTKGKDYVRTSTRGR